MDKISIFFYKIYFFCAVSFPLAVLLPSCGLFDHEEKQVVIVVGSRAITLNDLKKDVAFISSAMDVSGQQGQQIRDQLVEQIIDHYLILEYSKKKRIAISKKELESALKDITKEYTDNSFEEALLRGDVDYEEWKGRLREKLLIKKTIRKLTESIVPPSYQDIKRYFEANRDEFRSPRMVMFRQIVTSTKEEADKLLKRLHNGEDMGALAKKFSVTPEAEKGGEVGWLALNHLEGTMGKVLASIPQGRISPVINTPYGYHIFEVLGVQTEGPKEFPEVIQEIESRLLGQKREAFYKKWLGELRSHFKIKVNQDLFNKLELS